MLGTVGVSSVLNVKYPIDLKQRLLFPSLTSWSCVPVYSSLLPAGLELLIHNVTKHSAVFIWTQTAVESHSQFAALPFKVIKEPFQLISHQAVCEMMIWLGTVSPSRLTHVETSNDLIDFAAELQTRDRVNLRQTQCHLHRPTDVTLKTGCYRLKGLLLFLWFNTLNINHKHFQPPHRFLLWCFCFRSETESVITIDLILFSLNWLMMIPPDILCVLRGFSVWVSCSVVSVWTFTLILHTGR